MTDTFQISNTSTLADLETVLNTVFPVSPDWTYKPFSTTVKLANGLTQGNGYPVIKWRFNHIELSHRETLRENFCPVPALSKSSVYIHTPITETDSGALIWKTFKCILNLTIEEEDFQADRDLGLLLTFTHCEVQA
jgi:hypothetical protein